MRASRVRARNAARGQTFSFEVTPMMFEFMERWFEPPDATERDASIVIDTSA